MSDSLSVCVAATKIAVAAATSAKSPKRGCKNRENPVAKRCKSLQNLVKNRAKPAKTKKT